MSIAVLPPIAASTWPTSVVGTADPRDAPEIGRSGEPGDVGRAATAERDERPGAVEPELAPQPPQHPDRLRLLPGRKVVRRRQPVAERLLCARPVDAHHVRRRPRARRGRRRARARRAGRASRARGARRPRRAPRCRRRSRPRPRPRGRAAGAPRTAGGTSSRCARAAGSSCARAARRSAGRRRRRSVNAPRIVSRFSGDRHRAAAERDHAGLGVRERDPRPRAPRSGGTPPPALVEQLGDRLARALLDRRVEVEERAAEARRELAAERRLAGAHEPDQDDVPVEGVFGTERGSGQEMRSR